MLRATDLIRNGGEEATVEKVQERISRRVDLEAVYLSLVRLEQKGLVEVFYPAPEGKDKPPARFKITAAGERALAAARENADGLGALGDLLY